VSAGLGWGSWSPTRSRTRPALIEAGRRVKRVRSAACAPHAPPAAARRRRRPTPPRFIASAPQGQPVARAVAPALRQLDSSALAALIKELGRQGEGCAGAGREEAGPASHAWRPPQPAQRVPQRTACRRLPPLG
jgi:hypothetical protein